MEDLKKRQHIPAFGHWDYCPDLPITQYFESALQAGLIRTHFWADDTTHSDIDDDLFKVAAATPKPVHRHHHKVKRAAKQQQPPQRKQATVRPKAVDEDLYKIPPELLYQKPKPKMKRLFRGLVSGLLGLSCIR